MAPSEALGGDIETRFESTGLADALHWSTAPVIGMHVRPAGTPPSLRLALIVKPVGASRRRVQRRLPHGEAMLAARRLHAAGGQGARGDGRAHDLPGDRLARHHR
eukprot:1176154-Prymnesium_polylepis.1